MIDLAASIANAKPRAVLRLRGRHVVGAPLVIERSLSIEGGTIVGTHAGAVFDVVPGATLTLQQVRITPASTGGAIWCAGALTAKRCTLKGGVFGVRAVGRAKLSVLDCSFTANGRALDLYERTTGTVCRTRILRALDGISLVGTAACLIEESRIANASLNGIVIGGNARATIMGNEITANTTGIVVEGNARGSIVGNQLVRNRAFGIYVSERSRLRLAENECRGNRIGLRIGGTAAPSVVDADCSENKQSGITIGDRAKPRLLRASSCGNGEHGILVADRAAPVIDASTCSDNRASGIAIVGNGAPRIIIARCFGNRQLGIAAFSKAVVRLDHVLLDDNKGGGLALYNSARATSKGSRFIGNAGSDLAIDPRAVFVER